jgi:hypothetical protein
MIFFISGLVVLQFINYSLEWFTFTLEFSLAQVVLMYFLLRLFFLKNNYQLVGYATLILILLGVYLFILQFDVFACFLLVAESVVMLFILSILMHLNYTNITETVSSNTILVGLLPVTFLATSTDSSNYSYWVDWFSCQISQYNDLLPQYIYFYLNDSPVVLLVGIWLLILTFLLVHLILRVSLSKSYFSNSVIYFRKTQNI